MLDIIDETELEHLLFQYIKQKHCLFDDTNYKVNFKFKRENNKLVVEAEWTAVS